MEKTKVRVGIKGVASLLMHKFNGEEQQKTRGKKVYDDKEETEKALYKDEEGIYAPNTWIKAMLVLASKDFRIKGHQNYSKYVKGGIIITTEKIRGNLNKIGYEVYKCPVVIQRSRIMRCRPLFKEGWKLELDVSIIDPQISPELLKEFFIAGGMYCGLGDSRPEFGRFEVEKFEVVKK